MNVEPANKFDRLRSLLPDADALRTDVQSHPEYFHDATEFSAEPGAVLMASTREDVITAVRFCTEHAIPITPRGAGTGLSGGCIPSPGALVISTERINHLSIDPSKQLAICGPGVITMHLLNEAKRSGLTYPPDPASYEESTLGGNVAEGAGGLRCKRFGVTKDYVIGLEAVLADGAVLRTGALSDYTGFLLGDLLIASEGTLGIITEIAVRLTKPVPPGVTILAAFPTPRDAAQTVSDMTAAGIVPTVLEFLDGDAAVCSNEYEHNEGLESAGAILLIETDGSASDDQSAIVQQYCEKNRSLFLRTETDLKKTDELWKIRRNLSKATKEIAGYRISEDIVVPVSRFPDLVEFVAQMNERSPLRINSFGHAGDGNLHVNFLARDGSPDQLALVEEGIRQLMKKTLALGGTLTGEHGIGLAKRDFLAWEFDPATLDAMRRIKRVFDPAGLLNPDKLFPK